MNKLSITFLAISMMAYFISVTAGGSKNMEIFVKEYRNMKCKQWKLDLDVGEELVRSKCKKEAEKDSICISTCYYQHIGLLDENFQLVTNQKKLAAKLEKTGIYSNRELAEFLAEVWINSGCEKKLPPAGASDCDKAKKGSLCLSIATAKPCGLKGDKAVIAKMQSR